MKVSSYPGNKVSCSRQQLWDFSLGLALKSRQNLITAVVELRMSVGQASS